MTKLVYIGDCPCAVVTDCVRQRQYEGLTSSSLLRFVPGPWVWRLEDCVCICRIGDMNLVCR